ncbi:MAG: family 43 glycosylhydrolase [Nibricoccus sp.]
MKRHDTQKISASQSLSSTVSWEVRRAFPALRICFMTVMLFTLIPPASAAEWLLTGELGAHDPCLIKEESDYANGNWWWSPATGPGLSMKFSTDGIKWRQGLQFFTEDSKPVWWTEYAPAMRPLNVWAPDLQKFGNRFWCYYSVSEFGKNNSAIGLTSSSGIFRGDWQDDGVVISSKQNKDTYNAVDPSLVIDEQGSPWLTFGSYYDGLHLVQLDPKTMKPAANAAILTIARRQRDLGLEAPTIVYANGYYYLFVAIDVCCNGKVSTHKVACGRAKNIVGPYEGKPGDVKNAVTNMLTGNLTILEKGDERWAGMGGAYVYRRGDGWIIVRHGYDKNSGGTPKMRINDLYWDAQGWPTFVAPDLPNQTVAAGETVNFTAPSSITYQWQVSTDNGATWANITDNATYNGASKLTLAVKASSTMNGHKYRVVTGNGGATSNAFLLTVKDTE